MHPSHVVGKHTGTYYLPVITQCSIRHLYTIPDLPRAHKDALVAVAKKMERRRCNHHTLDHPLSTLECFSSVIDPRNSKINKNRYVIASQEEEVRRYCRGVKGVPLVYVKRSVMVMEPMADSSVGVREGIERGKLRTGLRANGHAAGVKRKRGESSDDVGQAQDSGSHEPQEGKGLKKKTRGPKGPNPLSVKKRRISKDSLERTEEAEKASENLNEKIQLEREADGSRSSMVDIGSSDEKQNSPTKRKRKRKHKKTSLKEIGDEGRHDDRDGI